MTASAPPSDEAAAEHQAQQDVLKSKILTGEFVVTSQNYSSSPTQKSLLAEKIVKLMDQVFLSTEVHRVYARTEVTNISPNRVGGILVECNIVLAESITYAAQQFGIALYDSLTKSNERLANQPGYLIDKNSIKFNTIPDKDLKSGLVPLNVLSPVIRKEFSLEFDATPGATAGPGPSSDPSGSAPPTSDEPQLNLVVWSEWSQWSSCVDKNGLCDPSRLHSRLRTCVAQHTGEKVDESRCKQRFNLHDKALEVVDCSRSCSQQSRQSTASSDAFGPPSVLSDAPSMVGPQTAPSVMVNGNEPVVLSPFGGFFGPKLGGPKHVPLGLAGQPSPSEADFPQPDYLAAASQPSVSSSTERSVASAGPSTSASPNEIGATSSLATPALALSPPPLPAAASGSGSGSLEPQMTCSNCTSDEICLLLMQQKTPFCAKIKDPTDERGCGGWCKASSQLCQPAGQNAFKCIHDSECLAEEWRCHDSACIPLSKRCDGHSNCYDSSDERACPVS